MVTAVKEKTQARTRLHKHTRDRLFDHACEFIDALAEERFQLEKLEKKLKAAVAKRVRVEYPKKDMEILNRYQVADSEFTIKAMGDNRRSTVEEVVFSADDTLLVPSTRNHYDNIVILLSGDDEELLENVIEAGKQTEKFKDDKRRTYRALIFDATYFEQVVDVWPAAERMANQIGVYLPKCLNEAAVKEIQQDNEIAKVAGLKF